MSIQNNYLGISNDLFTKEIQIAGYIFYKCVKRINKLEGFPLTDEFLNCSGVDFNRDLAEVKATNEVYERYAMSLKVFTNYYGNSPQITNWDEHVLKMRRISKTDYNPSKINWIKVKSAINSQITYLPEEFINFKVVKPSGFYEVNSNGFSCHLNDEESTINGLFEVIERHTVLNNWFNQRKIYSLHKSLLPIWIREMINLFKNEGWVISINFLKNEFSIPTVWILGCNKRERYLLFGAKSSFKLESAIKGAFLEFITNLTNKKQFDIRMVSYIHNRIDILKNSKRIESKLYCEEFSGEHSLGDLNRLLTKNNEFDYFKIEFSLPEIRTQERVVNRIVIPHLDYFYYSLNFRMALSQLPTKVLSPYHI